MKRGDTDPRWRLSSGSVMAQCRQQAPAWAGLGAGGRCALRWGGRARVVSGVWVGGSVLPRFPVRVPRLSAGHRWMGNRISFGAEGCAQASGRPSLAAPWAEWSQAAAPLPRSGGARIYSPRASLRGLALPPLGGKAGSGRAEGAWLRLPGPWPASHWAGALPTFHRPSPPLEGQRAEPHPRGPPPPPVFMVLVGEPMPARAAHGHSHQSEGGGGGWRGREAACVGRSLHLGALGLALGETLRPSRKHM